MTSNARDQHAATAVLTMHISATPPDYSQAMLRYGRSFAVAEPLFGIAKMLDDRKTFPEIESHFGAQPGIRFIHFLGGKRHAVTSLPTAVCADVSDGVRAVSRQRSAPKT